MVHEVLMSGGLCLQSKSPRHIVKGPLKEVVDYYRLDSPGTRRLWLQHSHQLGNPLTGSAKTVNGHLADYKSVKQMTVRIFNERGIILPNQKSMPYI